MSLKRPRQELAYRFRHLGLGAAEITSKKELQRRLRIVWLLKDNFEDNAEDFDDVNALDLMEMHLLAELRALLYTGNEPIYPPIDRLPRNFAHFEQFHFDRCEILFRFTYERLLVLYNLLGMDADCILENGTHISSEEVFLFSLCRLTYPDRLNTMTNDLWGGEESQWSRAFKYFNLFVQVSHGHRLTDNFAFWVPRFPGMARAVQTKLEEFGVHYGENEVQQIACFLDDTVREICRPGAGPTNRHLENTNETQRAFYSGWCGHHALVWQTVDSPCGMIIHAFGPGAGRHQDRERVRLSGINELLRDAQLGNNYQYKMYGDNIFVSKSHLLVRHAGQDYALTQRQVEENYARPKVRIGIEWNYRTTSGLFKFCNYVENCKICAAGSNAALTYFTAMFLKNCHVCMYHSESASYFNIVPPTIEEYLH